jgi:hypothetical protein
MGRIRPIFKVLCSASAQGRRHRRSAQRGRAQNAGLFYVNTLLEVLSLGALPFNRLRGCPQIREGSPLWYDSPAAQPFRLI